MSMYLGSKKIQATEDLGNRVLVKFKDGSQEELSKLMFEASKTSGPVDLTKLRDTRCHPVVEKIIAILLEWDVKMSEIDYILNLTASSLNMSQESASNLLWKKDKMERTVYDVEAVLKAHRTINDIANANKPEK